jgi:hypothetical protein
LRKVVDKGDLCIDAPEGNICMDPRASTGHHMYLLSVDEKHDVHVDKDFGVIQPYWLASIGTSSPRDDPQEQYGRTTCPEVMRLEIIRGASPGAIFHTLIETCDDGDIFLTCTSSRMFSRF